MDWNRLCENCFNLTPNIVDAGIRVNFFGSDLAGQQLKYRNRLVLEGRETLFYGVDIVITSPTCLSVIEQPLLHHVLRTLDEECKFEVRTFAKNAIPYFIVLHT